MAPPATQNDDMYPTFVVPFGAYGAGGWTGHPIGLVIVVGIVVLALIGLPPTRLFFFSSVMFGALLGFVLWRRQLAGLFRQEILPFGQFGEGPLKVRLAGMALPFAILLIGLLGTPLVRFFFAVAIAIGALVGLALRFRHERDTPSLFSRKT